VAKDAVGGIDAGGRLLQRALIVIGKTDAQAHFGEPPRDSEADATGGTRDHGGVARLQGRMDGHLDVL
jgi:hypothetical protein